MRFFPSFFSRVASGVPLQAPLKLTCHSPPSAPPCLPSPRREMGEMEKSRNRYWLHPAASKALHNTALTDGHLILTVVFPQMEMFFLLPALCRDEVAPPLFVTRPDVLRMSCCFILSTLEWDCFVFKCSFCLTNEIFDEITITTVIPLWNKINVQNDLYSLQAW